MAGRSRRSEDGTNGRSEIGGPARFDIVSREEMFLLELHPELLPECAPALDSLLRQAVERDDVWIATMGDVARWWRERSGFDAEAVPRASAAELTVDVPRWPAGMRAALCVTGDVDCVTFWDYAWRLVKR